MNFVILGVILTLMSSIPTQGGEEVSDQYTDGSYDYELDGSEYGPPDDLPIEEFSGKFRVDKEGHFEYQKYRDDLVVRSNKIVRGRVDLTLQRDESGFDQIHLVFDREIIGSGVRDPYEIAVSSDGEELEYVGQNSFHENSDEEGYYVTMVDDETHVFVRLHFSERSLSIYEYVDTTPITPGKYGVYGLILGIFVVVSAAALLFYKK